MAKEKARPETGRAFVVFPMVNELSTGVEV